MFYYENVIKQRVVTDEQHIRTTNYINKNFHAPPGD